MPVITIETILPASIGDILTFASPLGFLGAAVDHLVLCAYLRRMLTTRNDALKAAVARSR